MTEAPVLTPAKGRFLFKGLISDLRCRLPVYWSDYRDALHIKILASTLFIFFTSILPAITFGVYLNVNTNGQVGTAEVLLSTGACGIVFAILGGQPLLIVGVTGPIAIFTTTVYTICTRLEIPFLPFTSWIGVWGALFLIVIAVTNANNLNSVRAFIDLWKVGTLESSLLSLLIGLGSFYLCAVVHNARAWHILLPIIRGIIADYGAVIAVLIFTLVPYIPLWSTVPIVRLDVPSTFQTTSGRNWFLSEMADLPVGLCFAAALPALVLIILIYFDHNVSSLLSQRSEFNLKKPTAFHWDFIVIALTMLGCALLGLPYSHALIPQAPLHVRSLAVIKSRDGKPYYHRVLENRVSNLLQAILVCASLAVLFIIGYIPSAVMAGFFLYMGYTAFLENQLTERWKAIFTQRAKRPDVRHITRVPFWPMVGFTVIQLVFCGVIFGITLTPAAIAFPVCILIMIPTRKFLLPRIFTKENLELLDSEKALPADPVEPTPADEEVIVPTGIETEYQQSILSEVELSPAAGALVLPRRKPVNQEEAAAEVVEQSSASSSSASSASLDELTGSVSESMEPLEPLERV